jgi:hypothetical protein
LFYEFLTNSIFYQWITDFLCLVISYKLKRFHNIWVVFIGEWYQWHIFLYNVAWLLDYLRFYVPLKNISIIWRRHHCRWRAAKFRPMLGVQGLRAGRDLYRATPAVTRDLGFSGLIRRTAPFSRLLRHTRGYGGSILTRILTGGYNVAQPHEKCIRISPIYVHWTGMRFWVADCQVGALPHLVCCDDGGRPSDPLGVGMGLLEDIYVGV